MLTPATREARRQRSDNENSQEADPAETWLRENRAPGRNSELSVNGLLPRQPQGGTERFLHRHLAKETSVRIKKPRKPPCVECK